ncbi:MAG: PAS domain S-box protein [Burkholderiales bacterium]|nr:PAS domain S-box protein [Burkholderiales bacterium]
MFQAQIQAMPFVRALWFVDAKGAVQYESDPLNSVSDEGLPGMDVDYVALFSAQPQRDFYMGVPARGGQHGAWLIHAARPVRSASGAVTGVLVAAIDTRYFEALWRHIDLGIDGSMGLLRRDGVLLIRSPFVASAMGKSFKQRPVFTTLLPAQPHGNYTDASGVDGVQRMFSYRTLSAHPDMVVIVGQSYAQVLAPWWRWVRLVLLVWVGSWGGMFGIAYFLARVWRQKQDSEHTLRASEARYRSLYQHAMDAILVTRTDGRVLHANPAACALFDRTEADIQALGRTGLLDVSDPRLAVALATRAATGHFRGELTFIRANGDRFPGEFTTSVFTAGNGEIHTTIIIRDVSERKKTDAALQQYADKLQVLSRRIIDTQEAERRRLASELHDELGQSLTALKINLQSGVLFKNRSLEALNRKPGGEGKVELAAVAFGWNRSPRVGRGVVIQEGGGGWAHGGGELQDRAGFRSVGWPHWRTDPVVLATTVASRKGGGGRTLALVEQLRPDVVLMDITMPAPNGLDATLLVTRQWPQTRTPPVRKQDVALAGLLVICSKMQRLPNYTPPYTPCWRAVST